MQNTDRHITNKQSLYHALQRLAEADDSEISACVSEIAAADSEWRMSHPLNEMTGRDQALESVWRPLKRALPDLERRDLILVGGEYQGRDYVAAVGHYCGTFRKDWLSIPATGRPVYLRYGEVY